MLATHLLNLPERVVVPGERVEGAQLVPAGAQLLGDVAAEAADVCAHRNDTKLMQKNIQKLGVPHTWARRGSGF